MSDTPCVTCTNLAGCPLLAVSGRFAPQNVIRIGSSRICDQWSATTERELQFRTYVKERVGNLYMVLLHTSMRPELEDLKVLEEEEMTEVPDFDSMRWPGMTREEREQQLRYETDEEGKPIRDKHTKQFIPRGTFAVRAYATDPKGPIKEVPGVVMFWPQDALIEAILLAEGFPKKPKRSKTGSPEGKPGKKEKEEEMAKVIVRRKNAKTEKTEKADKTPAKVKGRGKVAQPATAKKRNEDSGSSGDLKALEKNVVMAITLLHDVMMTKLNGMAVGIDLALGAIDGVESKIFTGPMEGKGKNKNPKLDWDCLLNKEKDITSYFENASDDSNDSEDEDEEEEATEEEEEEEGEEEEEDDDE